MSVMQQQQQQEAVSPEEAKEKVKEKGQELKTQASQRSRQELRTRARSAGQQAQSLAQTARRVSSELETQGQQSQASVLEQVAVRSEQLAGYLTQTDPDTMLEDGRRYASKAVDLAREQPVLLAAAGVTVGFLASKLAASVGGGQ